MRKSIQPVLLDSGLFESRIAGVTPPAMVLGEVTGVCRCDFVSGLSGIMVSH